eukprot:jgi/Mesvir1/6432/Mv25841-RA.1
MIGFCELTLVLSMTCGILKGGGAAAVVSPTRSEGGGSVDRGWRGATGLLVSGLARATAPLAFLVSGLARVTVPLAFWSVGWHAPPQGGPTT